MSDRYRRPRVVPVGDVRDITDGPSGPLYDGHYAGQAYASTHYDTVETVAPLPAKD
jgi:hypothetical protein